MEEQANILAELRQEILLMEGFKPALSSAVNNGGLSLIKDAFPNRSFPLSVLHEFITTTAEDTAASYGFIAAIVSALMNSNGITAWITSKPVFPHALKTYGIDPEKILFIQPPQQRFTLFVLEEVLKCDGLTAMIAEVKELGFTESRRLQLAAEESGVTGFLVRQQPKTITTCAVTRWKIKHLLADKKEQLPGVGFPQWNVELLKVRNGKPGKWQMQWTAGRFELVQQPAISIEVPLRKVV